MNGIGEAIPSAEPRILSARHTETLGRTSRADSRFPLETHNEDRLGSQRDRDHKGLDFGFFSASRRCVRFAVPGFTTRFYFTTRL
jgi:hypothetical protein